MMDFQKASIVKRISAGLLDLILLAVLAAGFLLLIAKITNYDKYSDDLSARYEEYSEQVGVNINITSDEYELLTDDQKEDYDAKYNAFVSLIQNDLECVKIYNICVNLIIIMFSIGILLSYLLLEFIVPLIFKNGQTIGKKIFGLALVNKNCVKVNSTQVLIRTLFGKYTLETMIPFFLLYMIIFDSLGILGFIIIVAIAIIELIILFVDWKRPLLHDLLAYTYVCDFASQKIFESEEARIKFSEENNK